MSQFTASEVRDAITWKYGDKLTRISAMLTAYADMLEARERAALAAHSAQAQQPAASVPKLRYFIGGPRACAYVDKFEHVEAVITALCKCTGDARDDYTSTDLIVSERVR